MRHCNTVKLSGTIFWSKLDDRQTYTTLRMGIKLGNGGSAFVTVNNPSAKGYEITKPGNKVLITNGWLDTWEKQDGTSEVQIKASDSSVQFFGKEKAIADINYISIVGKILAIDEEYAIVEMIGDRNPKTNQPAIRKAKIKIGEGYNQEAVNSQLYTEGTITSVEIEGKSKILIQADYNKTTIL